MITAVGEVKYLLLADEAAPYLLARVRWPDVAQAITAGCPDWLDDLGLFDLPYDPGAVQVSFAQAASVAAGWGRQLSAEPAVGVPSFIRRMPANWSLLSPAERRAWGLDSVRRPRVSARRLRRLRAAQPEISAPASAEAAANGHGQVPGMTSGSRSAATERRDQVRVHVAGRAHIASGSVTFSAGLVDLSEDGVRCVLPEADPVLASGVILDGPFLLEAEVTTSRICLSVRGRICWSRSFRAGTHFGVAFPELDEAGTGGVRRFLTAAGST